jgi:hypothetical protein
MGYGYWQGAETARRYKSANELSEAFKASREFKSETSFENSVLIISSRSIEKDRDEVPLLWLQWLALAGRAPAVAMRVILWMWAGFERWPESKV